MITRQTLIEFIDTTLKPKLVRDYCPNGLQVEGAPEVRHIVTGVTASQALIDAAIAAGADTILVHHGYFWKGEAYEITGMKKQRLAKLLGHNINLLAYHLPLDIHPQLGNNSQLGQLLGLGAGSELATVEPKGVVRMAQLPNAQPLPSITTTIVNVLARTPLVHASRACPDLLVQNVAWCTGGGQGYIDAAAAAGAQLFISGEVSEQTIHSADELGIHFIAAGHHATERFGVKALGEAIAAAFPTVKVEFMDITNPA